MMRGVVADRVYSAEEVDAAVAAIADPERLRHAEEVVTHGAAALHQILLAALEQGGYFGNAHAAESARAAGIPDLDERLAAVKTLVTEETRLGMFVGVAIGFELAHELIANRNDKE